MAHLQSHIYLNGSEFWISLTQTIDHILCSGEAAIIWNTL